MKLDRPDDAASVLNNALGVTVSGGRDGHRDLHDMRMDVQTLLLLVEVHRLQQSSMDIGSAIPDTLMRARDMQKSVVNESRVLRSSVEAIEAEKLVLSVLCEQLGAALTERGNLQEAENCLNDALTTNPHNTAALYSMAVLARTKGISVEDEHTYVPFYIHDYSQTSNNSSPGVHIYII